MDGSSIVVMGDRGRLVVPAAVRGRAGLNEGDRLVLLDGPGGIVLLTQAQALARVRSDLVGLDLVGGLLAERRAAAQDDSS
jgi:AbrB family looped-hinge helix DNA binding protein